MYGACGFFFIIVHICPSDPHPDPKSEFSRFANKSLENIETIQLHASTSYISYLSKERRETWALSDATCKLILHHPQLGWPRTPQFCKRSTFKDRKTPQLLATTWRQLKTHELWDQDGCLYRI